MSNQIKSLMLSLALTIAAAIGLAGIASPAQAQSSTGLSQTSLDGGVQDCTTGCYISTCDASGKCTVYYCDGASGCHQVGQYQKVPNNVKHANDGLPAGRNLAFNAFDDVAYVKTCSGDHCQLYELTTTKVSKVGYVENIDEVVKELRAKHAAGEG